MMTYKRYEELYSELVRDYYIPRGIVLKAVPGIEGESEISGKKGLVWEMPHKNYLKGTIEEYYDFAFIDKAYKRIAEKWELE